METVEDQSFSIEPGQRTNTNIFGDSVDEKDEFLHLILVENLNKSEVHFSINKSLLHSDSTKRCAMVPQKDFLGKIKKNILEDIFEKMRHIPYWNGFRLY